MGAGVESGDDFGGWKDEVRMGVVEGLRDSGVKGLRISNCGFGIWWGVRCLGFSDGGKFWGWKSGNGLKGREENSPGRSPGKSGSKGGALKGRKNGLVFYDS